MTDQGFRFCPRCGTALVEGLPYCPKCGFNVAELTSGSRPVAGGTDQARDPDPYDWGAGARGTDASEPMRSNEEPGRPIVNDLKPRGSRGSSILLAGLAIAVGLVAYALITRPDAGTQPSAAPAGGSGAPVSLAPGVTPAPPAPSAPIVGLTIQSPRDGEVIATSEVTVIGLAPPGLSITRDVSFGLDQHTTVDGTGHWAIGVRLDPGQNTLTFRIGDDRSTEQKIRVTYQPPV